MIPGYNHNVPHRGRAYHVQTEDLGRANPHVVTHVFLGGNVVAVKKTSYASLLGAVDVSGPVRELMREQHKEMVRELVAGRYDSQPGESAPRVPDGAAGAPRASDARRAGPDGATALGQARPAIPRPLPCGISAAAGAGATGPALDVGGDDTLEQAILAYLSGEPRGGGGGA